MPTNAELEKQIVTLSTQVAQLSMSSSKLFDEVATLRNNYSKLVEDVSTRLEVVHEKIFR